jgi:heme-degrading monooxygenase HmoA
MVIATLAVDGSREDEFERLFEKRRAQSLRLGALDHQVWRLVEPGEDPGRWFGIITFRDMEHLQQFSAAQDADAEAQQTIAQAIGPGGPAQALSFRFAVREA